MKTSIVNKKPLAENWKTHIVVNILIKRESVFYGIRKKKNVGNKDQITLREISISRDKNLSKLHVPSAGKNHFLCIICTKIIFALLFNSIVVTKTLQI